MAEQQHVPPEEVAPAEVEWQEEASPPPPAPPRPRRGSREFPTPPAPPRERITVGEREYEVDPGIAAHIRTMEQAYGRLEQIERRSQEQADWRDGVQRAVLGEQPQPQDELETLWFSNPREAARRLTEQVTSQVEARYNARESSNAFWGTFEGEYPELAPQRKLVQYLLATEPGLGQLPNSQECRAQLAKATREWALSAMQGARQSGTVPQRPSVPPVETGTRRRSATAPRPEPAQPQSMTAFRRARREERRQHRLRLVQGG